MIGDFNFFNFDIYIININKKMLLNMKALIFFKVKVKVPITEHFKISFLLRNSITKIEIKAIKIGGEKILVISINFTQYKNYYFCIVFNLIRNIKLHFSFKIKVFNKLPFHIRYIYYLHAPINGTHRKYTANITSNIFSIFVFIFYQKNWHLNYLLN